MTAAQSPAQSWKVTLPCTRIEAEALDGEIAAFALMERPPVLMTAADAAMYAAKRNGGNQVRHA